MANIQIEEVEELAKCPHCEKDLDKILVNFHGFWTQHAVYFCPYCKKVLGVGLGRTS